MPNIGAPELIIILVIALLILGPGKLPEVGASIGKSIREFRKASSDVQDTMNVDTSPLPAAAPAAPAAAAAAGARRRRRPSPRPSRRPGPGRRCGRRAGRSGSRRRGRARRRAGPGGALSAAPSATEPTTGSD